MKHILTAACLSAMSVLIAQSAFADGYPPCHYAPGYSIDYTDSTEAFLMVNCLADPDPAIRDDVAYTTIVEILRNHTPDAPELFELMNMLVERLDDAGSDPNGFQGPFVALALAEIARTDRVHGWMSADMRSDLVTIGAEYLSGVSDYRGFDDDEGWRHGVAHGADLLMQLSLNDAITEDDALMILAAIASKVAPADGPAYTFGESERLARPVLFLARSGKVSDETWDAFFAMIAPDESDPRWQAPYASQAGLNALHNTRAFANTLYVNGDVSDAEALNALRDRSLELIISLP